MSAVSSADCHVPRHTPVRGACPTPLKSLESDLMEDLAELQSLIRGEEVARDELSKWLGLDGE